MRLSQYILKAIAPAVLLAHFGCSENPVAPPTSGSIKFSIMGISRATQAALNKVSQDTAMVTITSARIVIQEIEFESTDGDSLDFELEDPFVQDLVTGTSMQIITNILIPFGSYKESEIEIDDLDPDDGTVYTDNPELQDKSVVIKGYLNGDSTQTFIFSSALKKTQEMDFSPPLVLDENNPTTNVVLTLDMDSWFLDENGNCLDPNSEGDRSQIEQNIKNSIDAFEDEDDDGEDDDDDGDDDGDDD